MTETPKTIAFVATIKSHELLKRWAAEDDRTVSAIIRRLLEQEARRRQAHQEPV